jgi:hypothetical protein
LAHYLLKDLLEANMSRTLYGGLVLSLAFAVSCFTPLVANAQTPATSGPSALRVDFSPAKVPAPAKALDLTTVRKSVAAEVERQAPKDSQTATQKKGLSRGKKVMSSAFAVIGAVLGALADQAAANLPMGASAVSAGGLGAAPGTGTWFLW